MVTLGARAAERPDAPDSGVSSATLGVCGPCCATAGASKVRKRRRGRATHRRSLRNDRWSAVGRDFRSSEATLVPAVVQSAPLARGTARINGLVPLPDASGLSRITLAGAGWAPNESIVVYECTAPAPTPLCIAVGALTTDAAGAFSLSQTVTSAFRFMPPYSQATVDCVWPSSACELLVTYSGARVALAGSAHVPLVFAGATSAPFSAPHASSMVEKSSSMQVQIDARGHELRRKADARRDAALQRAGSLMLPP